MRTGNAIAGLAGGLTIAATACGAAAPARAGALFEPPAGCAVYLTTQNRDSCPTVDPDQRRIHGSVPGSGAGGGRIDGDARRVESGPVAEPDRRRSLRPDAATRGSRALNAAGGKVCAVIARSGGGIVGLLRGFDGVSAGFAVESRVAGLAEVFGPRRNTGVFAVGGGA
ncbi:hypothetical protein [Ponticoccus sp. (in: a-proteobacteria)]|uniref:hypothetical protein n=1 Tax=Ponticoccus sp. (in: a-proteobacteria) TaxID=1925025 RepID=UPI003AB30B2B